DGVAEVVDAPDSIVGADGDAVRPGEHPLAPGGLERAVGGEHQDRGLAAGEHEDAVLAVGGHGGHLPPAPAGGEFRPLGIGLVAEIATVAGVEHVVPFFAGQWGRIITWAGLIALWAALFAVISKARGTESRPERTWVMVGPSRTRPDA